MENENIKSSQKKKKTKYKTSRLIIVILALLAALAVLFGIGKFAFGIFSSQESPEELALRYEEQVNIAKATLGDNIIYVQSTFEDNDGAKYKGISFLNEMDLLFIGDKGFEKRISLDFIQDVAVSEDSNSYDISVTDEDGSIYKLSKIQKTDEAEGFIVILTR